MKLFNIHIKGKYHNPWHTWWKARKYFVMPKMKFCFFWVHRILPIDKDSADKFNIKTFKLFGKTYYHSIQYCQPYGSNDGVGKILDLRSADVMWKSKWGTARHEMDPYIYCCIFGLFGVHVRFDIKYLDDTCTERDGGMYYWEYLLDYLYCNKSLKSPGAWTYESKVYRINDNGTAKQFTMLINTPAFSLNKRGRKVFADIYKKTTQNES